MPKKYPVYFSVLVSVLLIKTGYAASVNPSEVIKFVNKTPYTLQLANIDNSATDYCVNNDNEKADCNAIIAPGHIQRFYVANQSGFNVGYNINSPRISYYNLNIQNWSNITFSATTILDTDTTYFANKNSIEFTFRKPISRFDVTQYTALPFRGINLAGAEAGSTYLAQWLPTTVDANYFVKQGMNTIRFPVNWNYIVEGTCNDACRATQVNSMYLDSIYGTTRELLASGVNVILDVHDYMRFTNDIGNGTAGSGDVVSETVMANLWLLIAQKFEPLAKQYDGKDSKNQLIFELNNEPNSMPTTQVLKNTNAAIHVIRVSGIHNLILIEGNQWSGLHSWTTDVGTDGLTNADEMTSGNIQDSDNNYAIAVHQYFDSNASGTSPYCQSLSAFQNSANFTAFMNWVHENKVKVILDEFGSGAEQNCVDDVNWLLSQIEANPYDSDKGGFIGWTAWVGGHGWSLNNFNNLSPNQVTAEPTTQMTQVYANHLTSSGE